MPLREGRRARGSVPLRGGRRARAAGPAGDDGNGKMQALWEFLIEIVRRTAWFWRVIQPDQAGVRTTMGRWPRAPGPGLHLLWPVVGEIRTCNVAERVKDVRSQSLTTEDGHVVAAGISVAYSVIDPYRAMFAVADAEAALLNEALRVVGEYVGAHTFEDCSNVNTTCGYVLDELRKVATSRWGLKIWRVGLSDWAKHRAIRLMGEYSVN